MGLSASTPESGSGIFPLDHEMQFATELLEVSGEKPLDKVIARLIAKSSRPATGNPIRTYAYRHLGGLLKSAAEMALPQLRLASNVQPGDTPAPFDGTATSMQAGRLLGLELEGLSGEDSEFEIARQFVRFARDAIKRLGHGSGGVEDAQRAYLDAAREHAPGLIPFNTEMRKPSRHWSGKWVRHGRTITLV